MNMFDGTTTKSKTAKSKTQKIKKNQLYTVKQVIKYLDNSEWDEDVEQVLESLVTLGKLNVERKGKNKFFSKK